MNIQRNRKNKNFIIKYGKTALLILWMAVIFMFSHAPADDSTEVSRRAGRIIGSITVKDFEEWSDKKQEVFLERIDHTVRKSAHFTEYMILGILCLAVLGSQKRGKSWLLGTCYAITDEIHQYFIPGRSCQISDMVLDSFGVAAGVILAAAAVKMFYVCREKKEKNQ
ncbi:VanZ family protein [Clostridium sp. AM58-1XD]|uniref:VanZ family protein n=1 Tax=Clostridium sp. AM58-1XD TaxID=2292307 RepID=UPI000E50F7AE|nr:VanZ family protein [Clostridium sp. AM58-1XD]RGY96753.1 VanZ family protein [Clostridium sp. AM58-1XD]